MKHRIYSFPLGQRKANSQSSQRKYHKSPVSRAGPLWGQGGGSSSSHNSYTLLGGQRQAWTRGSWPALPEFGGHACRLQPSRRRSNLEFRKEKPANAVWSMESMRFLSL